MQSVIKLKQFNWEDDHKPILIGVNNIISVEPVILHKQGVAQSAIATRIKSRGALIETFCVFETVDQVYDLIAASNALSKPEPEPEPEDFVIDIPSEQVTIIRQALSFYKKSIEEVCPSDSQELGHKLFDIHTLESLLHYKVSVRMSQTNRDRFTSVHGVDLPMYVK